MSGIGNLTNSDSFMARMREQQSTMQFVRAGPGAGKTFPKYVMNDDRGKQTAFNKSQLAAMLEQKQAASRQSTLNAHSTTGTFINRPNYPSANTSSSYSAQVAANEGHRPLSFSSYVDTVPSKYLWIAVGVLLLYILLKK